MNLLKSIYYNQHYKLKGQDRTNIARSNGSLMLSFTFTAQFFILTIIVLTLNPDWEFTLQRGLNDIFGRKYAPDFWNLMLFGPWPLFFILLYRTWGSKKGYQKIVEPFDQLPEDTQRSLAARGRFFFIANFLFCVLFVLVYALVPQ